MPTKKKKTIKIVKKKKRTRRTQKKSTKKVYKHQGRDYERRLANAAKRSFTAKYMNRPSPAISATRMSIGTRARGNDGQVYVVKLRSNGTQFWSLL
jgi:hypothetical protein